MAQSTILGFPRIGKKRELKSTLEAFWKGKSTSQELLAKAKEMRALHWQEQKAAGIDLIPSNDFSFYDQMLDMSALVGAIPARYNWKGGNIDLTTYFAMARGIQKDNMDVPAEDMTKWFDTNYHYIVPEFEVQQKFSLSSTKPVDEFLEAKALGITTRPVLVGPVSYLMLGKRQGGHSLELLNALLPCYVELLQKLEAAGAEWIQLDEPCLVLDLDEKARSAYNDAYATLRKSTKLKIFVATYFGSTRENLTTALKLPIDALHLDMLRGEDQLAAALEQIPASMTLSLGVVNGRNIWRNNLSASLDLLEKAAAKLGSDRLWVGSSCSLLHSPYDLDEETGLDAEIKSWLAFAHQKLLEISVLTRGLNAGRAAISSELALSTKASETRKTSERIHNRLVAERLKAQPLSSAGRKSSFDKRRKVQTARLKLPAYPTTTIGSFPQTVEVRKYRADAKAGRINEEVYEAFLKDQVRNAIKFQEEIGLDVLVHGEFERTDMVEYFGENFSGFAFTKNGWVQSYGSRCVKPPIIYGDVARPHPMTIAWSSFAQSLTDKPVKGMLTGPVTILQWSFVRDDQPRSVTTHQIALALQDEVLDLEKAGIKVIQIDEPAVREGLPLRHSEWADYLNWASHAFSLSYTGVEDDTQIHTHMCYAEFNDIFDSIKDLDADVISIETSRSQMEILEAFSRFKYPNEIGPGVYDIHSPRVPNVEEMVGLLKKASAQLEPWQIWVNPDCGLKTRDWKETREALEKMVSAARIMRAS